ncbi:hypothetical protein [Anaerovibrio lipolyticus]|uniref:hypothetical protein n=1 Tax=Anaerovibrio lipolyticus TaxID=82374 RepID=UPI0013565219|nr:hypothetical protein [Anaerovibrio lipolyticus]
MFDIMDIEGHVDVSVSYHLFWEVVPMGLYEQLSLLIALLNLLVAIFTYVK